MPAWTKGQSGNPGGRPVEKPWSDAIKRALARAEAKQDYRSLNALADKLLDRAAEGDMSALKELGDRLEGKVPQAIVGSDEHPPVQISLQSTDANL